MQFVIDNQSLTFFSGKKKNLNFADKLKFLFYLNPKFELRHISSECYIVQNVMSVFHKIILYLTQTLIEMLFRGTDTRA